MLTFHSGPGDTTTIRLGDVIVGSMTDVTTYGTRIKSPCWVSLNLPDMSNSVRSAPSLEAGERIAEVMLREWLRRAGVAQ